MLSILSAGAKRHCFARPGDFTKKNGSTSFHGALAEMSTTSVGAKERPRHADHTRVRPRLPFFRPRAVRKLLSSRFAHFFPTSLHHSHCTQNLRFRYPVALSVRTLHTRYTFTGPFRARDCPLQSIASRCGDERNAPTSSSPSCKRIPAEALGSPCNPPLRVVPPGVAFSWSGFPAVPLASLPATPLDGLLEADGFGAKRNLAWSEQRSSV